MSGAEVFIVWANTDTPWGGCKTVKLARPALLFIRRLFFLTPLIPSRCRQFREHCKVGYYGKKELASKL